MSLAPDTSTLINYLKGVQSAVLALSGGLDSVFLMKALSMSGIRALAVTGSTATTPPRDLQDAIRYAKESGVEHRVIDSGEMVREGFLANSSERCYHCKDSLFGLLEAIAREGGYACILDGGNLDDLDDHRPGRRAAAEHGVLSPLIECGFTKDDIRSAARGLGLEIATKPASPCLSSRFAYGVRITPEGLIRVKRAEDFIREIMGVDDLRVRDLGGRASIEVPEGEVIRLMENRARVVERLKLLGFGAVEIDPEGFRSGKLNRALDNG
jgi:uncharacterized protein